MNTSYGSGRVVAPDGVQRDLTCSTTCPSATGQRSSAGCAARGRVRINRQALGELQALAAELERSHPGAASSLKEGMEETLTVTRLGVHGALKRTLQSTNPCESMIECVRRSSRNVKRWQSGEMCLRWTAAGMLEAERQFRRIIGHKDLAKLALTVEREITQSTITHVSEEAATLVTI
jgi:hypothetical protein